MALVVGHSKYRNKRTMVDGLLFASKKEAKRWGELKLLEKAGEITGLRRQVMYRLDFNGVHICKYFADFVYVEHYSLKSTTVVEDVKGVRTDVYKIKKKLMKACYGIEIREI